MTLRTLAVATLAASALGIARHAPAIIPTDSGASSTYGQLHRGGSLGLLGRLDELPLSPASSQEAGVGCEREGPGHGARHHHAEGHSQGKGHPGRATGPDAGHPGKGKAHGRQRGPRSR